MQLFIIISGLIAATVAIRGHTWEQSKRGVRKITITGWVAIACACVSALASYGVIKAQDEESDALKKKLSETASDALILLTQELADKGAEMKIIPRVALFCGTARTVPVDTSPPDELLEAEPLMKALTKEFASVSGLSLRVRLFDRIDEEKSLSRESRYPDRKVLEMSGVSEIRAIGGGQRLSFMAIVQDEANRPTLELVRAVFNRRGFIEYKGEYSSQVTERELARRFSKVQREGFGYFYLGSTAKVRLLFSLEPEEPILTKVNGKRYVTLRWRIGMVDGIKRSNEE